MKRVALGIAAALAFSSVTSAHSLFPSDPAGLNLRQGPGTQHPTVTILGPGESATLLERQGDWFKVQTRSGQTAWAAAWVSRVVYDSPLGAEVTAANGLNLRRGPGADQPLVAALNRGERIAVLETVGDWHRVRTTAGAEGWVAAAHTRLTPPAPAPPPVPAEGTPAPPAGGAASPAPGVAGFQVRVEKAVSLAVASAPVRRGTHPGYEAVDTARASDSLRYLDAIAGWVKVSTPRQVNGWIHGRNLALWDRSTEFRLAPLYRLDQGKWRVDFLPARTVTAGDGLWLRSGPAANAAAVQLMHRGTVLKVMEEQGNWVRVLTQDGRTGWAARAYTASLAAPEPRVRSVALTQTAPGVMQLAITGRLDGAAIQPLAEGNGLLIALPDGAARTAQLPVADAGIKDLAVAAAGVQVRFSRSPAYQVREQTADRLVLEFRPAVVSVQQVDEPGRTTFRLGIAGTVTPSARADGDDLVLELPGALLKTDALPPGLTAETAGTSLRLRYPSRNPFLLKRLDGALDLTVLSPGLNGKLIMLDPGHGGVETGAIAASGLQEKDVNLQVALKLKARLEQAGAVVLLTRDADRRAAPPEVLSSVPESETLRTDLDYRTQLANAAQVDLFLSIHANSHPSTAESGTETFWSQDNLNSGRSQLLATLVQQQLVAALGRKDRGVKTDIFYVTRFTDAPAALAELAFLSNRTEAALLADPAVQDRAAAALYQALEQFFAGR